MSKLLSVFLGLGAVLAVVAAQAQESGPADSPRQIA